MEESHLGKQISYKIKDIYREVKHSASCDPSDFDFHCCANCGIESPADSLATG